MRPSPPAVNENDGGVTIFFRSAAAAPALPGFDGVDVGVGKADVVTDLVHQHVADQLEQADVAALGPFIEDGAAVEEDVAHLRLKVQRRAMPDVRSLIEAGQ